MIAILEWAGCATGLAGASLLSFNNEYSGWGFVLFFISNILWIVYGHITQATGILIMQIGFTITSLIGTWRWLISGY